MLGSRSIIVTAIAIGLLASSTVGVPAQQDEAAISPPTEFSGQILCGPWVRDATTERTSWDGGRLWTESRGDAWRQTATMSDPRLEGEIHLSSDGYTYSHPGSAGNEETSLFWSTVSIENDEGAWQGSAVSFEYPDALGSTTARALWTWVLTGEGGYEGLTAVYDLAFNEAYLPCGADVYGIIFEGSPAIPEPYAPGQAAAVPDQVAFTELRVTDIATLDERTRDLTIESPSVGEARVCLLLPAGFDEDAEAMYPVLYLLHGAWDDALASTRCAEADPPHYSTVLAVKDPFTTPDYPVASISRADCAVLVRLVAEDGSSEEFESCTVSDEPYDVPENQGTVPTETLTYGGGECIWSSDHAPTEGVSLWASALRNARLVPRGQPTSRKAQGSQGLGAGGQPLRYRCSNGLPPPVRGRHHHPASSPPTKSAARAGRHGVGRSAWQRVRAGCGHEPLRHPVVHVMEAGLEPVTIELNRFSQR